MADVSDWVAIAGRGLAAADVFLEISAIIADLRSRNTQLGGDDRAFGEMVCAHLGRVTIPCVKEGSL